MAIETNRLVRGKKKKPVDDRVVQLKSISLMPLYYRIKLINRTRNTLKRINHKR